MWAQKWFVGWFYFLKRKLCWKFESVLFSKVQSDEITVCLVWDNTFIFCLSRRYYILDKCKLSVFEFLLMQHLFWSFKLRNLEREKEWRIMRIKHSVFGRSVNPISTSGSRLCPPQYYEPPRIFRPCDGPAVCMVHYQIKIDVLHSSYVVLIKCN